MLVPGGLGMANLKAVVKKFYGIEALGTVLVMCNMCSETTGMLVVPLPPSLLTVRHVK